jgi:uncharacterized surface protein with fasciclin (FAS1) repeats
MEFHMSKRIAVIFAALVLTLAAFPAAADHHGGNYGQSKNIVETAREAGQFSTLLAAVEAAGLTEALSGEGPFTVFAPTDEAFAAIPEDQLAALLEDTDTLTAILTYHVVSGKVLAADVVELDSATTLQGSDVTIEASNYGVRIDGARVVATDIEASNGVIHVIDAVITP